MDNKIDMELKYLQKREKKRRKRLKALNGNKVLIYDLEFTLPLDGDDWYKIIKERHFGRN